MEKIEIKYDKKKLLPIIIFFAACIIGSTYFIFFTDKFATNQNIKFLIIPVNLFALYMIFTQMKRLLDNSSIVTLTKNYIEINEDGKPLTFSWTEIKELRIEKRQSGKSEVDILSIKSDTRTGEVNISPLDKNVDDIRGLIRNYRP
ncbi:MAG: hypothetical protein HWD62_13180 [Cyclobacteriaceae bacterium]|nr:MAG: hypothetical protein HWD62_13180 [Cyclobacteriaceae bacterium]